MKNILFIFTLLVFHNSFSQKHFCGNTEIMGGAVNENLDYENAVPSESKNYSPKNRANENYIIPVVFHVIHQNGAENVSAALIEEAIQIANADFQKTHDKVGEISPLFEAVAADTEIEFRLARIDPDGNCTNGITRTISDLTVGAGENVKELIGWDTYKYLNVWVVKSIYLGPNFQGYSWRPGKAPSQENEGIVFKATAIADGTSILAHEMGHFLNLSHTWGNSNSQGDQNNCNIDDGVSDTPNTVGTSFNCNLNQISCSSTDNVQNYMDYSNCRRMFTKGQKFRMEVALGSPIGGRYDLWQEANLIATGTNDGAENCFTAIENPLEKNLSLRIFPNPITNNSIVEMMLYRPTNITLELTDILGNSIKKTHLGKIDGAYQSLFLNNLNEMTPGVYFLHVGINNEQVIRKIIL